MFAILQGLGWALAGAFAYNAFDSAKRKRQAEDASRQNALSMAATSLKLGRTYAVQIMVDPNQPSWGGANAPRDIARGSALIANTYAQLGWRLLSNPSPDPAASKAFLEGKPTVWTFTGVWSRPASESAQVLAPSWATMTVAFELPVLPAPVK